MSEDKVISKKIINEFGVPLDGSIVESMGKTTKVPDYITGLTPLQLANLALETAKGSLRGRSSAETAEAISGGEKDTARTIASVVEGIPRLVTDLAEPIVKKFYPEKAEEFRDASTDMLKLIGAGVSKATGVDEEDIIDSETGKAKFSETIPGLAVDMGTILFTGGALFKKIDDAIPNAEKFSGKVYNATKNLKINIPAIKNWLAYVAKTEVAYAGASQLLIDPDASLPNVLKSLDLETLKKDNPFADLINYLVTEKEEPELKKRASMLVSDLMAGGAFMTVLKALGMTGKGALNFVKGKIRGKEPDADEMEALVGELLPAMRQETRPNKELPLIAREDTAEGLKQVKKQAMAGKSIKEIAPTILYRTKQRWFTRRGFYSR